MMGFDTSLAREERTAGRRLWSRWAKLIVRSIPDAQGNRYWDLRVNASRTRQYQDCVSKISAFRD